MSESKRNFTEDKRTCDAATAGLDAIDNHVITMYLDDANDDGLVGVFKREADAIFVVEARTGWPAALTEIERLCSALEQIKERGWSESFGGGYSYSGENHAVCISIAKEALGDGTR